MENENNECCGGNCHCENKMIVGEDMICPVTGYHCDDECCTPGSECNLSGEKDK